MTSFSDAAGSWGWPLGVSFLGLPQYSGASQVPLPAPSSEYVHFRWDWDEAAQNQWSELRAAWLKAMRSCCEVANVPWVHDISPTKAVTVSSAKNWIHVFSSLRSDGEPEMSGQGPVPWTGAAKRHPK